MRLPQARDFDRLRLLLSLIASGIEDRTIIGQKMGAKAQYAARHADYYRWAAEILGVLDRDRWSLTARGKRPARNEGRSIEERDFLRAAVADATELGDVRDALLSDTEPDTSFLVHYALDKVQSRITATVERRVRELSVGACDWGASRHLILLSVLRATPKGRSEKIGRLTSLSFPAVPSCRSTGRNGTTVADVVLDFSIHSENCEMGRPSQSGKDAHRN